MEQPRRPTVGQAGQAAREKVEENQAVYGDVQHAAAEIALLLLAKVKINE